MVCMHHCDSSCTSCQLEIPEGVTILHVEYDVACPTKLSSHESHDSCMWHGSHLLDPFGTRPKNADEADFARRTLAHCLPIGATAVGSQWQT